MDDKQKRKAEVRARLEKAVTERKKKGLMTPARKKKLRTLLRKKAVEELKREKERKAEERRKIISQRTSQPRNADDFNEEKLESEKYDLEYEVTLRDLEVREVASRVNDVRRRSIKPPLEKVSKTAQQMEKIRMFTAKIGQMDYSQSLKTVTKKFELEDKEEEKEKSEWAQL